MPPDNSTETPPEQSLRYQLKSFWRLWPYLWPKDRPSYKLRTLLAMVFTIAGQFIVVAAPFFLGRAIDAMDLQVKELGLGTIISTGLILLMLPLYSPIFGSPSRQRNGD